MSETEHLIGKLTHMDLIGNETVEDLAHRLIDPSGEKELASYYSNWIEYMQEGEDCGYFYDKVEGRIYSLEYSEVDPYSDVMIASMANYGDIDFEVRFYNGGCSLNEAIGTSLDIMRKGIEDDE